MTRRPALDEMDGDHWKDEGRSPYSSGLWGVAQAERAAVARKKARSLPGLFQNIGSMEHCWCGDYRGHDWPGRDEGKPHPR